MSESRNSSESRYDSRLQVSNTRYNNLDDIDSLIEKLERETPIIRSNNPRINQALELRRQKIEELKRLRDEAKREAEEEEKQLRMLEQSNDELDDIIGNVKKMVRKSIKPKNNSTSSSYSLYNYSSESHNSSESRCSYSSYDYSSESHDSGESRW